MGYTKAILSILLLLLTIARTLFPAYIPTLLYRILSLTNLVLTNPHTHPYLRALLLSVHHPQPPTPPPRPSALASSPFRLLPPETIQHIASLLAPCATACFASTCLPIRLAIGTQQYLPLLRTNPYDMLTFLEFLVVDIVAASLPPSHLFCLYCFRLVPYPAICGPSATPICTQIAAAVSYPCRPTSFTTQLFHTVMVIYRRGHDPYPLIATLLPRSLTTTTSLHDGGITTQVAQEYRIIQGSLHQRTRVTIVLPRSENNCTVNIQPCIHYLTYQARMNRVAMAMQAHARDRSGVQAVTSEMLSCQKCRTVLRIGCRKFRGLGLGLFVTWWFDLGDGEWANNKGAGWKDVKYSRKWLMDYFDSLCHGQRYFDFDGIDTYADRKELLAMARSCSM